MATINSQLEMYYIKAPFDGIVDEIFPKIGEIASPMSPMIRLINVDKVYIKADVSERYLNKIAVGDTAIIEIPSLNYSIKSSINRIGSFINPNNRSFKVRFDFSNNNNGLKPNLLAKIKIKDYGKNKAIVVPTKVIQESPNGDEFVYTISVEGDGIVQKKMVKTGMAYEGKVEVLEGLVKDEVIITEGGRSLKDGDIVNVSSK